MLLCTQQEFAVESSAEPGDILGNKLICSPDSVIGQKQQLCK